MKIWKTWVLGVVFGCEWVGGWVGVVDLYWLCPFLYRIYHFLMLYRFFLFLYKLYLLNIKHDLTDKKTKTMTMTMTFSKHLQRAIFDTLGVSQMLTIADGGGRGVQEPLILADVICEQPLNTLWFLPSPILGMTIKDTIGHNMGVCISPFS